ncbi:MAG: thermonuclease family protein [Microscillaceae bacterium]|nr:thermonuclease family protein [Microscillaceae bacterium]
MNFEFAQKLYTPIYDFTLEYEPFSYLILFIGAYLLYRLLGIIWLFLGLLVPFRGRLTQVVRCADGDTIIVGNPKSRRRRHKVRLIGVDTPESLRSLYQDVMPFGKEASLYTKKRLKQGTWVMLFYDRESRDDFGRILAYVYLLNGEFFNATLVRKGYAFAKEYPPNLKHQRKFNRLERSARVRRKGLWSIYRSETELRERYLNSSEYRKFRRIYGEF